MDPLGLKERNAMSSVCNTYPYQSLLEKSDEIYHYTCLGTLQIILNKKQLRFTNRAYLNDKSEGTYVLTLCKEKIAELWPWEDSSCKRNTKEKFCEYLDRKINNFDTGLFQSYQASFSYKSDSLSMWNYYAQGDGCNIQFANDFMESFRSRLIRSDMTLIFLYGKVIYNQTDQINLLRTIFERFKLFADTPYVDYLYECMIHCIVKLGAFFKHPSFEDERECRIVFNLSTPPDSNAFNQLVHPEKGEPYKRSVYIKQGMLVPYVDIDFDLKYLQSIMVSPTANFAKIEEGIKIMLREQGLESREVKPSRIPLRF